MLRMCPRRVRTSNDVDHELVATLRIGVMRLARRLRHERSGSDLTLTQLSALGTLSRTATSPSASWRRSRTSSRRR